MPIKRAAYKAMRSDKKKHAKNMSTISRVRTLKKNLLSVIPSKNKAEIEKASRAFISAVDKAGQKGIIHRKNASRTIARMSVQVHKALAK